MVVLRLYVQPGAKRTEIVGLVGDELKIRLAASPIEGRANTSLLKYLSQLFQVPKSKVVLKFGEKSRHKVVVIHGQIELPDSLLSLR